LVLADPNPNCSMPNFQPGSESRLMAQLRLTKSDWEGWS
jgi:hypothetical protein